jgi:hypothetical protein
VQAIAACLVGEKVCGPMEMVIVSSPVDVDRGQTDDGNAAKALTRAAAPSGTIPEEHCTQSKIGSQE